MKAIVNGEAFTENRQENNSRIWTIPNILSFVRLGLIPIIAWCYCYEKNMTWAAVLLVFSGITDMADGYIARHFNQTSNLGKALDPVADKLTQIVMLFCLVTRYPKMVIPFALLLIKEIVTGVMSLMVIRKTEVVTGADWHGKITTVLLYGMMVLHIIWPTIPSAASNVTISVCVVMMAMSFILYGIRNVSALIKKREGTV